MVSLALVSGSSSLNVDPLLEFSHHFFDGAGLSFQDSIARAHWRQVLLIYFECFSERLESLTRESIMIGAILEI